MAEIDEYGEDYYEYVHPNSWKRLEGIKDILKNNEELLSKLDFDITYYCNKYLEKKPKESIN